LADKLHTTLIAVCVRGETGLETLVDRIITIPHEELTDYVAVASRIGLYVASCMRERHKLIATR